MKKLEYKIKVIQGRTIGVQRIEYYVEGNSVDAATFDVVMRHEQGVDQILQTARVNNRLEEIHSALVSQAIVTKDAEKGIRTKLSAIELVLNDLNSTIESIRTDLQEIGTDGVKAAIEAQLERVACEARKVLGAIK